MAGGTEIATAYVQVVPTTQGITSELEKALGGEGEGLGESLGAGILGGSTAGLSAGAVAAIGAIVAVAKGVWDASNAYGEYGDNIDKTSQKMGISAQAYQEWAYILEHNGSSIDTMQRGMTRLQSAASDSKEAFEELGISQTELAQLSDSPEELFAATIEGLQGIENASDRTRIATELFGTGMASNLMPLLNMTPEETEEMRQKFHELGGALGGEGVKNAAAFEDALTDLRTAWTGLKNEVVGPIVPVLTAGINALATAISYLHGPTEDWIEEMQEAGKLGAAGESLDDYKERVEELNAEWEELDKTLAQPRDPELYSIEDWNEMQDRYDALPYMIRGAEDEYYAMQAAAADASAVAEATGASVEEVTAAAEQAAVRMTEAYQTAYQSAYDSITGQIGLFGEFKASLSEDTDTTAEMIQRWTEQQQAMNEYATNLQKADAYELAPELIATLSDGSAESAAVLAQIVSEIEELGVGSEEASSLVEQLNSAFAGVEEAKDTLSDTAAMGQLGALNGQAYVDGLESSEGDATSAGQVLADAPASPIEAMAGSAYGWGFDMGGNFANGLTAQIPAVSAAAESLAAAAAGPLQHSVPKEGPLAHDDEWGYHMMDNFIAGIRGSEDNLRNTLHSALDIGDVTATATANGGGGLLQVVNLLNMYLPQLMSRSIHLDDGAVIGRYAPGMDTEMGGRRSYAARGLAI